MEFYVLASPQGQQNITQSYNGRISSSPSFSPSFFLSLCAHKKCSMLQRMRCFKTRLRRTRICTLPSSSCSMRFSSMTNDNGCHLPRVCVCVSCLPCLQLEASSNIFKRNSFLKLLNFLAGKPVKTI